MRSTHAHIAGVMAGCAVEIVLGVPGFAQSNNSYRTMTAIERTSAGAMREYVRPVVATASAELPANVVVPSIYQRLIETMMERSPTFRRQCLRIAQTQGLRVHLEAGSAHVPAHVRARTHILRRDGQVVATIQVLRLAAPVELIAHEFEHIIEQLDGVDLRARAGVTGSGVHLRHGDHPTFETTRATRVGLAVAAEVRRAGG